MGSPVVTQVLFAERTGRQLALDLVLLEGRGPRLATGAPLSVRLRLPVSTLVRAVVTATLGRWAEAGALVRLEVRPGEPCRRAVLSDGDTTIQLDVEAADAVPG